jgi:hypothetical protein
VSLALRKKERIPDEERIVSYMEEVIRDMTLVIIGLIRQEILCGIVDPQRFVKLKTKISVFEDFTIETDDYELAAEFYNECRKHGVQGSHIYFLICAVAVHNHVAILALDNDFEQYRRYIPITLGRMG